MSLENSIPALDKLCHACQQSPSHLGARLSGDGFGGFTLHLIEAAKEKEFLASFLPKAQTALGHPIQYFLTRPARRGQLCRSYGPKPKGLGFGDGLKIVLFDHGGGVPYLLSHLVYVLDTRHPARTKGVSGDVMFPIYPFNSLL